jgi:predicted esterase
MASSRVESVGRREANEEPERVETLRIETPRTARVAFLRSGDGPVREIWTLLHGYAESAPGFLGRLAPLARPGRLLVAPEGLSRFYRNEAGTGAGRGGGVGASWMTRTDRDAEIRDYVRYLDRVARTMEGQAHVSPRRSLGKKGRAGPGAPALLRVVLGFSQGVHTAARWTALGRTRPDVLYFWGASLPPDLPPAAVGRLKRTKLVFFRGDGDALRRPEEERRDERWMAEQEIPYRVLTHRGGHEVVPALLEKSFEEIQGGVEWTKR